MKTRSVSELAAGKGEVYVYCSSKEIGRRFMQDAGAEGFRFGNGTPANDINSSDIACITEEKQIMFAGYVGHLAFSFGKKGGKPIDRIDYGKYISGEKDYFYRK